MKKGITSGALKGSKISNNNSNNRDLKLLDGKSNKINYKK